MPNLKFSFYIVKNSQKFDLEQIRRVVALALSTAGPAKKPEFNSGSKPFF